MALPLALLTNDDGVDSHFFAALVAAAQTHFEVVVAAPREQQSWIGRALSRRRDVAVEAVQHPASGWAIHGTPTDAVNIALHHLLPRRPDVILSGMNIGYNLGSPLLLSSGTIAAALEGALLGIPSVAASQAVPRELFEAIHEADGQAPEAVEASLRESCRHAAAFARELVGQANETFIVHNLNYPMPTRPDSRLVRTRAGRRPAACLFQPAGPDNYRFGTSAPQGLPREEGSDRDALLAGHISHTVLNFSEIGRSKER